MGNTDIKTSAFERLAAVNVSEKVEKKNGFSYLSWAWAWDQLMRLDPDASYDYPDPKNFGDTMMVYCTVTAFGKSRTAHLPVMNYKNQPIPNPNAFEVNTAMQRCFVKAIALHGLGLYIYAGEDLPKVDNAVVDHVLNANVKPLNMKGNLAPDREEVIKRVYSSIVDCMEGGYLEEGLGAYMDVKDADEKAFLQSLMDKTARKFIKDAKAYVDGLNVASQA